jgi:hypothetical protein
MKALKLSECTLGVVVASCGDDRKIGHVVGLHKNSTGEVIPVVLWAGDAIPVAIHHSNIRKYKE